MKNKKNSKSQMHSLLMYIEYSMVQKEHTLRSYFKMRITCSTHNKLYTSCRFKPQSLNVCSVLRSKHTFRPMNNNPRHTHSIELLLCVVHTTTTHANRALPCPYNRTSLPLHDVCVYRLLVERRLPLCFGFFSLVHVLVCVK